MNTYTATRAEFPYRGEDPPGTRTGAIQISFEAENDDVAAAYASSLGYEVDSKPPTQPAQPTQPTPSPTPSPTTPGA